MNTRSRNKRLASPAKSLVGRTETCAPAVGGLGRSASQDPLKTDATETPIAPGVSRTCPVSTTGAAVKYDDTTSCRSHKASSSRSSATIRARRLSAEAELARRNLERDQEMLEKRM
ncbi:uncharacterized protein LOC126366226 [Pectinophora gossypiella]|uniref:uncharacterized protein LOC126366226 n=1 Tax=Pectinophora gossypiella TaxID=13191 RepID=UPI00214E1961|nr:uncharacterized protein LOC126366226 [Pectinophora gossypiella]